MLMIEEVLSNVADGTRSPRSQPSVRIGGSQQLFSKDVLSFIRYSWKTEYAQPEAGPQ